MKDFSTNGWEWLESKKFHKTGKIGVKEIHKLNQLLFFNEQNCFLR